MKQSNWAEWSIKHRQLVYFFVFLVFIMGLFSFRNLGRSEDKYIASVKHVDSYFSLYHYLIQCLLMDDAVENNLLGSLEGETELYFEKIKKHNSYCKDFVKALCIPFAYNLPRYQNLTIEGKFDMHNEADKKNERSTVSEATA